MTDAASLLADPDWIPHTFDHQGERLDFVRLAAADRDSLPFLAEEYVGRGFEHQILSYPEVAAAAPAEDALPIHFIFHSGFCCSTLLASALAAGGGLSVLREPDILMNIAQRLLRGPSAANVERMEVALRFLARPSRPADSKVVIKPSSFANNLTERLLQSRPRSRAVLIHSDLGAFLRAIAKKGMWGRIWCRKLYLQLSGWTDLRLGFGDSERFVMSDLQVAALCWILQARHFRQLAARYGKERLLLLHSDDLVADPAGALRLVSGLFQLNWNDAAISAVAEGEVFTRHSKSAERFGADQRADEHERTLEAHREEIEMVSQWAHKVAEAFATQLDLKDLDTRPDSGPV
jgi:hypothetical protein